MKALVWNGEAVVEERPVPPIPKGWVLGKVLAASLTSIDAAVTSGTLPVIPGRVLGSYGLIRVVEPGVDTPFGPGEVVGVTPLSSEGTLVIDLDGVMSEYASVPSDTIIDVGKNAVKSADLWKLLLMLEFSFVPKLTDIVGGKDVLILGTGISTYIIASFLKSYSRITVIGRESPFLKRLAGLGVKVLSTKKHLNKERSLFDAVILCAIHSYMAMASPTYLRSGGTLVLPPNTPHGKLVLSYPNTLSRIMIVRPEHGDLRDGEEVLRSVGADLLESVIGVAKSFEEVGVLRRHYARITYVRREGD